MKLKLLYLKFFRYEYWPYWIFYLPTVPYYFYLAFKAKSTTFFSNVNPAIYLSGIKGVSKSDILNHIPDQYKIKQIILDKKKDSISLCLKKIQSHFSYPIILKPDEGERGKAVRKIDNLEELIIALPNYSAKVIVQEYINFDYEFGVFYYRIPNSDIYGISSIVEKEFLKVVGDGKHSIKQLLRKQTRALIVWKYLKETISNNWDEILQKDEIRYPQMIGNHSKGTKFLNANYLINKNIASLFNTILKDYHGFNYGRFDLKVKEISDLETGNNLKIMELNGIVSEAAHIYDPEMNYFNAIKDVMNHFTIACDISIANSKLGIKPNTWVQIIKGN